MADANVAKQSFMSSLAEFLSRINSKPSADEKADITASVCEQYNASLFTAAETKIVAEILEILSQDIEIKIRKIIANSLKESTKIPHSIALRLAKDVEDEVALPVLEHSMVLTNEDLIEIVRSTKQTGRHMAIAKREKLAAGVVEELVKTANEMVVKTVIDNKGADISTKAAERIIKDFKESENVLEGLVSRGGLSLTLVEKMIHSVSDKLREKLAEKFDISAGVAKSISDSALEEMTVKIADYDKESRKTDDLIDQVKTKGKLSYSLLLRALCHGNLDFFESGISSLAEIPQSNCRKLINDSTMMGFAALYKAAELPDNLFDAAKIIMKMVLEAKKNGYEGRELTLNIHRRIIASGYEKTVKNMKFFTSMMTSGV